jgi:hypothetical protein
MAQQDNEDRPRERRRGHYPKEFREDALASSINRFSLPAALHIKVPNHGPLFRVLLSTHLSGSDGESMPQNERRTGDQSRDSQQSAFRDASRSCRPKTSGHVLDGDLARFLRTTSPPGTDP